MPTRLAGFMRASTLAATLSFLLAATAAAGDPIPQDPPSADSPNVATETADEESRNLDVEKSDPVKVIKMWRKVQGEWMLVWSIEDNINGGYTVTGQASKTTRITLSDGKWPEGTEVVVEIEVANGQGDSTSITSIGFNNKT